MMRYWSYDQLIMERLVFAAGLLPGSHQGNIRMRSHRLPWLDVSKSAGAWATYGFIDKLDES